MLFEYHFLYLYCIHKCFCLLSKCLLASESWNLQEDKTYWLPSSHLGVDFFCVAERKNFKLLFSGCWSFESIYFVQWEWLMPFCPGHLPGQHKRLCIAPSTSPFPHLLGAEQTSLNERAQTLFSLSYPGRFQQQTDGHLNTREHIQHLGLCFL